MARLPIEECGLQAPAHPPRGWVKFNRPQRRLREGPAPKSGRMTRSAGIRPYDDADGLTDVLVVRGGGRAARLHADWKRPSDA